MQWFYALKTFWLLILVQPLQKEMSLLSNLVRISIWTTQRIFINKKEKASPALRCTVPSTAAVTAEWQAKNRDDPQSCTKAWFVNGSGLFVWSGQTRRDRAAGQGKWVPANCPYYFYIAHTIFTLLIYSRQCATYRWAGSAIKSTFETLVVASQ